LNALEAKLGIYFDYWSEYRGINKWVQIRIDPKTKPLFEDVLNKVGIKYEITIKDIGALIRNQIELNNKPTEGLKDSFDYSKYHTLDEINHWMDDLETQYPKYVTVFNVSTSYQKRTIYAMKISIPNASKKPALWFDGGIHAREWIAPATVMYMAYSVIIYDYAMKLKFFFYSFFILIIVPFKLFS
jgi:hypothetical protein